MLFKIKSYIKFLISGTSKYSIHSPFLNHFIQDVLDHGGIFYCFPAIELVRKKVSQDKKTIKKSIQNRGAEKYRKMMPKCWKTEKTNGIRRGLKSRQNRSKIEA